MASPAFGSSAQSHTQANLPSLPAHLQSDTHLTAHLASRFHVSLPTARLGSQGLVSVNTYTTSTKGPHGGTEGSAMGEAQEMAGRILSRMGARSENQAVIFLGESGSGKTTVRAHLLSSLLAASSTPLSTKISLAAFLFDTLTTTKTVTTPTASKAGLFLELQYDASSTSHPTLIGGKLLDHRLERSRIASVPTGERTFHVLYYLLSGTSPAEKSHLGLDTPGLVTERATLPGSRISATIGQRRWRYLGHPTQLKVGINDAEGFQHFKTALRKLEFPRSDIAQICQILATILHLGQLEFHTSHATTPAADESGGYAQEGGEDITCVKNREVLEIAAAFLGLGVDELDARLGYKTKTIHRERVTVMLDPKGARANTDELARTLYSLLTALIIERVNQRVCAFEESIANTISLVDFPGFEQAAATGSVLDQLLNNAAAESMYNLALQHFFERRIDLLESEEVQVAATSYFDNTDATKGLLKPGNGLLCILDDQTRRGRTDTQFLDSVRKRFEKKNTAITASSATVFKPGSNFPVRNTNASFAVKHFAGEVDYPIEGLIEANGEVISGDMMNIMNSSTNDFVRALFGQDSLHTVVHPQEKTAVIQAQLSSKPSRMPSMARRRGERPARLAARQAEGIKSPEGDDIFSDEHAVKKRSKDGRKGNSQLSNLDHGASGQFQSSLDVIRKSVTASGTNSYFVFCLKPNDRRIANQFDSKCVRAQIQTLGIAEISQRLRNADFSIFLPFGEFLGLANSDDLLVGTEREKAEAVLMEKQWPANEGRAGTTGVFLSERCWLTLADVSNQPVRPKSPFFGGDVDEDEEYALDANDDSDDAKAMLMPSEHGGHAKKKFGSRDIDGRSDAGASAFNMGDMFRHFETRQQMAEKGNAKKLEEVEEVTVTGSRRRWLTIVWLLTWYLPNAFIKGVIRKRRKDIQVAWREKFAINILIWLSCLFVTFLLIGFPMLICPHQAVFGSDELASNNGKNGANSYVAIHGVVLDLGKYAPVHYPPPNIVPSSMLQKYAGLDVTGLFPVQVSSLCKGYGDMEVDKSIQLSSAPKNQTGVASKTGRNDPNAQYHDFRASTNDSRPDWFTEQMRMLNGGFRVGYVGYSAGWVSELAGKGSNIAILNNRVYDVSDYVKGSFISVKSGSSNKSGNQTRRADVNTQFMSPDVIALFSQMAGSDVTHAWNSLPLSHSDRVKQQNCLDQLFFVAQQDTRNSIQCQFANYFLLAVTILLVSVIGFKFFAALQFGKKPMPEHLDKFVICQVPAYTEDEDSLRRAIDSAARMRYDDKRKLLVVVCDGMIIGQGNDRPTPRIVLDILGVPDTVDPEPLSFESLGEGLKQHNMGKVYSGLYEVQGHIVPFLVIVKVGKPSEVSRPGNRGKRDSQMVLMRFLNRIHYNLPMNPLELEMHHQIRNVIGVNPTFYEFLFQIDADTFVAQDSATRMVDMFLQDSRLIGLCGETSLTNAKSSFITMIQVYEYYISHNLTKAFESLFGSVTCLPGCFSMYRIRAADTGKPLFVSREVVDAYANIRVDTLHMKNLLHLGEDRYLTTLLMKFHSKYKTKYTLHAKAWTVAPDSWTVFMSQRRRWINSTVHNLVELIPLQQLCGFCCFSMRFVVFVDLISTIVQPVTVFYIGYLIVLVATRTSVVPLTAFILLGAIYGLQAIIFVLRRKWEMIGWMIVYLLAMPVFSLGLPIYAFWHMDDFSWGNTRIVTGEKGRQVLVSDEGVFDPDSIPRKKWEDYQAELWEAQSSVRDFDDTRSEASGLSYATRSIMPGNAPSEYGGAAAASRSRLTLAPYGTSSENLLEPHTGALPPDDALLAEIRDILRTADLMSVTKKGVRQELERRFNVVLDGKRAYISSATEAVLSGQL